VYLDVSGPFSNSASITIMGVLLGVKKVTFTELCTAVGIPKSSLNRHLAMLEELSFVKQSRGFKFAVPGPRKFIEITPEGEQAVRAHLELIRRTAEGLLSSQSAAAKES